MQHKTLTALIELYQDKIDILNAIIENRDETIDDLTAQIVALESIIDYERETK